MSENERPTPFGPGFVAAAIVIAAVITCGLIVLLADGSSPTTNLSNPEIKAPSVTPVATSSRSGCSLPAGDQAVPAAAPAVDGWEVSRRVVVPRSAAFGPGVVDSDGFRRCFAHSPTGAVFAAYNVLAALGDPTKATATARKLLLPGPETDELLRTTESSSTTSEPTQLAGYRVLAASRDQVTVTLAVPVETQYMSLTVTMVWHDHDWRLQPPSSGAAIGAPFAQLRNLADFVKWSGL
ncbi:hypothetical protein ACFCV3_33715 [Kribbella sp. NPDC056345]|uniref:hypothetical protein n=1 Tax=Kribbella sp. NPDC056345 TaxID=3345789 RepID=UPI0035DA48CE